MGIFLLLAAAGLFVLSQGGGSGKQTPIDCDKAFGSLPKFYQDLIAKAGNKSDLLHVAGQIEAAGYTDAAFCLRVLASV